MANEKLLLETLEHIENNPQTWEQGDWYVWVGSDGHLVRGYGGITVEEVNSCGTAMCFAGHAAIKSGFPPAPAPEVGKTTLSPWKNEHGVEVMDYARDRLGLTRGQSDVLFDATNTLEDLRTLVEAIIDNPEIDEDELWELTSWGNSSDPDDDTW